MDTFFTYLNYKKNTKIITFLNKEIESLDSLIELHSNLESNKMSHDS